MNMTLCPLNVMFNEIVYLFFISEHKKRGLFIKLCSFQDLKMWNQGFS